ncbi:MAG: phosphoglucosamine mutase [Bacteroidia bacterium]|nr:MAG: phosphoglucosamine mutase [Bacteroidia bacterium]
MTLIKSVSGIRGTIGGIPEENLSPPDIVKFSSAFILLLQEKYKKKKLKIVVGRDARISGEAVFNLVSGTLIGMGATVIDIGLATTPTTEIAVNEELADGGIIITASHNPAQWNALKLLNKKGEFLSKEDGEQLLTRVKKNHFLYATVDDLGKIIRKDYLPRHIELILQHPLVNKKAIQEAGFSVAADVINSVGAIALPPLLRALGVSRLQLLHETPDGNFAHNPEPLPENLTAISQYMQEASADVAFVVDPDVDRLAIIDEKGQMFGEEYTLVAVADYVLQHRKGNTVSNLSSSKALQDISEKYGCQRYTSAVGEVNVVAEMKRTHAVIGGEGNGGVILPDLHYGRDALAGIALFLSHLAQKKMTCSELRKTYPNYSLSKNKVPLEPETNMDALLKKIEAKFSQNPEVEINTIDGLKLIFPDGWVHLRQSNTESIMRIYAEAENKKRAEELSDMLIKELV